MDNEVSGASLPPPPRAVDRTQLQRIIAGLFEGVLLIEPDGRIVWANEAALAMHGVRSVDEIGGTVDGYRERFHLRYRNRRRVEDGETPMDRVLAGEAFDEVVIEVTHAETGEEWTHSLRSIALADGAGEADCLVLVINDVTERFSAEERFERTFNANPAPALICRLADLRFVKVNAGFLEMTGYAREDLIGRSVYQVDVMRDAEKRELAIERLTEGRTIPQMEARLELPDGTGKSVVVAGQPIDIGDAACMLFTFMDLEPRKRAEGALRRSEERFAKSFRMAPVATVLFTLPDHVVIDANEAFDALTGRPREETVGRSPAELELWASGEARHALEGALAESGSLRGYPIGLRDESGALRDCLLATETVAIGETDCLLCSFQDITERRQSELELIEAIETVMQEGSWFGRTVVEKMADLRGSPGRNSDGAALGDLTPREREVLALVCEACSDDEIAERLGTARNTVRNQIASIYGKLDVHRRSALIVWARERGITGGAQLRPR